MITQKPTVSRLFLDLTALMAGAFVEKEIWFYPKNILKVVFSHRNLLWRKVEYSKLSNRKFRKLLNKLWNQPANHHKVRDIKRTQWYNAIGIQRQKSKKIWDTN